MRLTTAVLTPTTPTNHLQLKVSQITILAKEVCMGIHLNWAKLGSHAALSRCERR